MIFESFGHVIWSILFFGILLFCIVVYLLKWPVHVNCWFCNCWTKISRYKLNSWTCPNCQQYNGFTKDGDYNKIISEQKRGTQKTSIRCSNAVKTFETESDILCKLCSHHETMKMQLINKFETSDESNWDQELSRYRSYIERTYPLCKRCIRHTRDRVRQCDVTVLPKYVEWRKKRINQRDLLLSLSKLPLKQRVLSLAFSSTLYINFLCMLALIEQDYSSDSAVSRYINFLGWNLGQRRFCLFILCGVTTGLHLVTNCVLRFFNGPMLIHLGIVVSLITDQQVFLDNPNWVFCLSKFVCFLFTLAGLFKRIPPHLMKRYCSKLPCESVTSQMLTNSTSPMIKSLPTDNGDETSSVVSSRFSPTPTIYNYLNNEDEVASTFDTLSHYSSHMNASNNPFYLRNHTQTFSRPSSSANFAIPTAPSTFIKPARFQASQSLSKSSSDSFYSLPSVAGSHLSSAIIPRDYKNPSQFTDGALLTPNSSGNVSCNSSSGGSDISDQFPKSDTLATEMAPQEAKGHSVLSLVFRALLGVLIGITFTCGLRYLGSPIFLYIQKYELRTSNQ